MEPFTVFRNKYNKLQKKPKKYRIQTVNAFFEIRLEPKKNEVLYFSLILFIRIGNFIYKL